MSTRDELSKHIQSLGHSLEEPGDDDPNWDLAWREGEIFRIVQVVDIAGKDEEKKLRSGLGQILRIQFIVMSTAKEIVNAVLALDQQPADGSWEELCDSLGVVLTWLPDWPWLA